MASLQLTFTLRTSPNCKTVHLVGNWDGYKGQLPLSKDSSKAGAWKGNFRFQGKTLQQGQRYWYYYIMDGHHVSHDPAKPFTVEPTTKRKLNILDVPKAEKAALAINTKTTSSSSSSSKHSRRDSKGVVHGRGLSPDRIISPKPHKPSSTVDNITRSLASYSVDSSDDDSDTDFDSDSDESDVPSLTSSRSSDCSSPRTPASTTSRSSSRGSTGSSCSCNRFGLTRKGDRVKLDCGGSRCGSGSEGSDCSDSEPEPKKSSHSSTRRQGVVVRNSKR